MLGRPCNGCCYYFTGKFQSRIPNDSKQLSEKIRFKLQPILESEAVAFSVVHLDAHAVDELNILNASIRAMQECIIDLTVQPKSIIVDGNSPFIPRSGIKQRVGRKFTSHEITILNNIKSTSIIKGDSLYRSIAAASILAKTHRDAYMDQIHEEFPMYNWKKIKDTQLKNIEKLYVNTELLNTTACPFDFYQNNMN